MVFEHLSDSEVFSLMNKLQSEGLSEEDAFDEVYAIDCNMDDDSDPDFYDGEDENE